MKIRIILLVIILILSTMPMCAGFVKRVPRSTNVVQLTQAEKDAVRITEGAIYVYDRSIGMIFIYVIDKNRHYPELQPIGVVRAGTITYERIRENKTLIFLGD